MTPRYIYCPSHGAIHVWSELHPLWCDSAIDRGLDLRYPAYMQRECKWSDNQTMTFARLFVAEIGLWLYEGTAL